MATYLVTIEDEHGCLAAEPEFVEGSIRDAKEVVERKVDGTVPELVVSLYELTDISHHIGRMEQ